ncbi:hypothetical protein ACLB2K_062155 [Fragaria x ananassa]
MCRGVEEEAISVKASKGSRAWLYCPADDAYLCRKCDQSVHGANCLALRHVRCLLCKICQNLTERYVIGISAEVRLPTILRWVERSQQLLRISSSVPMPKETAQ